MYFYPHSGYRKSVQWMLDLNNIKHGDNESRLFHASMTPFSHIINDIFSIIVNPFGESYPESGNAEGVSFRTITSYIRDGGIFVNSGGQPFTYSWDVNTGNSQPIISFIPVLSDIQTNYVDGIPVLQIKENLRIPSKALLLKKCFGLETEWDDPANNIVGPKETEIEFDKLLGQDTPKTKAKVYRPVRKLSQVIIPCPRCSDLLWNNNNNISNNNIYPVFAVKFGRGYLVHTGMSLDEEREYKMLLDIITRLCLIGYETLAKS
jgi:hypothetical protein